MAHRNFKDRDGRLWRIIDRSSSEWEFRPEPGNPEPPRRVRPPGYEKDPFELSAEEVQRLLDSSAAPRGPRKESPFRD